MLKYDLRKEEHVIMKIKIGKKSKIILIIISVLIPATIGGIFLKKERTFKSNPYTDLGRLFDYREELYGEITIKGFKKPSEYNYTTLEIPQYLNNKPITRIAREAFKGNKVIEELIIGNNVIAIEEYAFANCHNLFYVKKSPPSYDDVTTNSKLEYIGIGSFSSNPNLISFGGFDNLMEIDELAFYNTKKLNFIELRDNVEKIAASAFMASKVDNIFIPVSVKTIGHRAFDNSLMTIYAETKSKPDGWEDDWCEKGTTVIWGSQRSDLPRLFSF